MISSGKAGENDPVARVVAQLSQFSEGLSSIGETIATAGSSYAKPQSLSENSVDQLRQIIDGLRAVPVQVDIKVVPVQDEDGSIEKVTQSSPLDIQPEVRQKTLKKEPRKARKTRKGDKEKGED